MTKIALRTKCLSFVENKFVSIDGIFRIVICKYNQEGCKSRTKLFFSSKALIFIIEILTFQCCKGAFKLKLDISIVILWMEVVVVFSFVFKLENAKKNIDHVRCNFYGKSVYNVWAESSTNRKSIRWYCSHMPKTIHHYCLAYWW